MKKYAKLNEFSRAVFSVYDNDEAANADGFLPYIEEDRPVPPENQTPHNYSQNFVERDGCIVRTWKAYPNYEAIEALKKLIASSDYKVIKCYESSLLSKELPYDIEIIHAERQAIRDEINRLEACEDYE